MDITLREAALEDREILSHLLEKYDYEFSQYDGRDVNRLGLYGYPYLDYYWTEKNRWAYFIEVDGRLAGFVMVNDYPEVPGRETDFCLSEFFVMYKYRRMGVGKECARRVFDLHRGRWQLKRHPRNTASVRFWNAVVSEYTGGRYTLVEAYPNHAVDYDDGTPADVFFFENGSSRRGGSRGDK